MPSSGQGWPFCTRPPSRQPASRNLTQTDFSVHFWYLCIVLCDKRDIIILIKLLPPPSNIRPASLTLKKCDKQAKVPDCVDILRKNCNNDPCYEDTTRTYMIFASSCDVRIFLSFLSSTGILSRIRFNLRIAC